MEDPAIGEYRRHSPHQRLAQGLSDSVAAERLRLEVQTNFPQQSRRAR
jgi:hypothetical protein